MRDHLADGRRGERLRDGFRVAIVGPPNAGKSSLLNALAGRAAAIVHPTAGTTRDVVEVALDLGGWPVVLADTAGLRTAAEPVEAEGIRRAHAEAESADLKMVVVDATVLPTVDADTAGMIDGRALVVVNKIDLADGFVSVPLAAGCLRVSAASGSGVAEVASALARMAGERLEGGAAPTRLRHRQAVDEAIGHLERASRADLPELMAEDLRLAARAIGRATGRIDVEDVLDAVFREFCIGK
ncbi:MAG: GTPase [Alphaproteobacteria bacterium]